MQEARGSGPGSVQRNSKSGNERSSMSWKNQPIPALCISFVCNESPHPELDAGWRLANLLVPLASYIMVTSKQGTEVPKMTCTVDL
eukprot:1158011-Pelagomonas_calceolata.AAC.4